MRKIVVLKHFAKLILKLRPSYIIVVLLNSLVVTATSILNIYIPKLLIDGITQNRGTDWFLTLLLAVAGAKLVLQILSNYIKKKRDTSAEVLRHYVELAFSEKVMAVNYKYLEDPKYLDIKERAIFAINNFGALDSLLGSVVSFASAVLTLGAVVGIMFSFSPVYMLISLGIAFLTVVVQKKYLSEEQKVLQELIPINRRFGYYSSNTFNLAQQSVIRIFRLDKILLARLAEKNIEVARWLTELRRKSGNASAYQLAIISAVNLITYAYAALRVLTDKFGSKIGIGDFTVYINSSEELIRSFRTAIMSVLNIMQQLGHLTPFAEFIEIPDSEALSSKGISLDEIETIEFRNVSFKYPSSEPMVLKDVSFRINKGERISIVGLNNAGKSTIVKLICRLFEPTEGEILVNGVNIKDYKLGD
jgi:ATP-binding cassette subfamily B protein